MYVLILVNTYRDKKISERPSENCTRPVIQLINNNNILLMTTWDLYRLWKDTLQGRDVVGVLRDLYNNKGDYKHSSKK